MMVTPVRSSMAGPSFSIRASQIGRVRRSCQTMARSAGIPVFLSQNTVVSRWLVMPMPAMFSGLRCAYEMACRIIFRVIS